MPPPAPPYQLVKGDRYNLTLGCIAAFVLAAAKNNTLLPPLVRWQLSAFTNWNLTFIAMRLALRQEQWDPFLTVNSVGIWLSFRTAMTQGIDENMRKKLAKNGLELPRWAFLTADHLIHTVPAALFVLSLVRRQQPIPRLNALYAAVLATWFAFRQSAQLDSSSIYVPHPWKRTWLSILAATVFTPMMVDRLIERNHGRAAACAIAMLLPYLSTRLDPDLKATYNFEFAVASVHEQRRREQDEALREARGMPRKGMPRAATESEMR